jgi:hypothetical protein
MGVCIVDLVITIDALLAEECMDIYEALLL